MVESLLMFNFMKFVLQHIICITLTLKEENLPFVEDYMN